MKNILSILLISVLFIGCSPEKVELSELSYETKYEYFDDSSYPITVYYHRGSKFNGVATIPAAIGDGWQPGTSDYREEREYKNGKRNGLTKKWYKNGQLRSETNYKDGEKDGIHKVWYENGQLEWEGNYKDGQYEGLWKAWWKNGQLELEVNYKYGLKDGLCKNWYENGQLGYERNYKSDLLISKKCWDEIGKEFICK